MEIILKFNGKQVTSFYYVEIGVFEIPLSDGRQVHFRTGSDMYQFLKENADAIEYD